MKKYILILIVIVAGVRLIAGNTPANEKNTTSFVSGKVVDKITGEEIAGAEVKIGDKTIYTDLNGNFFANIVNSKTEAVIKFISYKDSKINISPFSYNTIVVELVAK